MVRTAVARAVARVRASWIDIHDDERGDVPGWVLITLMTAGLAVVVQTLY